MMLHSHNFSGIILSQTMFDGVIWTTCTNFHKPAYFTWWTAVMDSICNMRMDLIILWRMCRKEAASILCYNELYRQSCMSRITDSSYVYVRIIHLRWSCQRNPTFIWNGCIDYVYIPTTTNLLNIHSASWLFLEVELYFPWDSSLSNLNSSPVILFYCITIIRWSVPFFVSFPSTYCLQITKALHVTWHFPFHSIWHDFNTSDQSGEYLGRRESKAKTEITDTSIISCNVESINFTKKSKSQIPSISFNPKLQRYEIALIVILNIFISNCIFIGAHAQVPNFDLNVSSSNDSVHSLWTTLICDQIPIKNLFSQNEISSCNQSRCYLTSQSPCCSNINSVTDVCTAERCNSTHSQTCCQALKRISDADNKAGRYIKMFSETMLKYATPETYSRRWSLNSCMVCTDDPF